MAEDKEKVIQDAIKEAQKAAEKIISEIKSLSVNGLPENIEKNSKIQMELFEDENKIILPKNEEHVIVENFHARSIVMPDHHEVRKEDVDLKRLGGVLATAYESDPRHLHILRFRPHTAL